MQVSGLQVRYSALSGAASHTTLLQDNANDYHNSLTALVNSISSSNLGDAKRYLAQVSQSTSVQEESNTPLASFLSSVSVALDNDDIAGAQNALANLKDDLAKSPQYSTSVADSYASSTASAEDSSWGQNVLRLAQAINANDLTQAVSSYNRLAQSIAVANKQGSGSELTSSQTSTVTTTQLQKIGVSLSSGDLSSAQTACDAFLASLSSGSIVRATA